jgi:hypothetical protein
MASQSSTSTQRNITKDNLKQHRTLRNCILALEKTLKEDYHTNEATLKHNFFHHLRTLNIEHQIRVEENLKSLINFNGRADFYLSDTSTKSYANDVVIEFKLNCLVSRSKEIMHDIKKLEGIQKLNPKIAPLFINFFTSQVRFEEIMKISQFFSSTKVYAIFIAPSIENYLFYNDREVRKYELSMPTIITSTARFLEQCIIPENIPTIRIPNLNGMTKKVGLCVKPKQIKHNSNKYIKYFELDLKKLKSKK